MLWLSLLCALGGGAVVVAVLPVLVAVVRWLEEPLRAAAIRARERDADAAERAEWRLEMDARDADLGLPRAASCYLSVVVPAYNERARLPSMLAAVAKYLAEHRSGISYEIVVVDDGSTDNTAVVAEESGAALFRSSARDNRGRVRVARLSRNRGKGGAVREGALRARGEWILVADADGATRVADLERLERAAGATNNPDRRRAPVVACGSRAHLVDSSVVARRSPLRNVLMRGFHLVVRIVGGIHHVRDTQCGFKLFSRAALPVLAGLHLERWAFDVEVLYVAHRLGFDVLEVPVQWTEIPGSKLNLVRDSLQMARDIACLRLAYATGVWRLPAPPAPHSTAVSRDANPRMSSSSS